MLSEYQALQEILNLEQLKIYIDKKVTIEKIQAFHKAACVCLHSGDRQLIAREALIHNMDGVSEDIKRQLHFWARTQLS